MTVPNDYLERWGGSLRPDQWGRLGVVISLTVVPDPDRPSEQELQRQLRRARPPI